MIGNSNIRNTYQFGVQGQIDELTRALFSVSDISVTIDPIKREDGQEIKVEQK